MEFLQEMAQAIICLSLFATCGKQNGHRIARETKNANNFRAIKMRAYVSTFANGYANNIYAWCRGLCKGKVN